MTDLLDLVVKKLDIHPITLMAFAYRYYEVPIHTKNLLELWAKYNLNKSVSTIVEDFCLDLLSNRTQLPKLCKCQRRELCTG